MYTKRHETYDRLRRVKLRRRPTRAFKCQRQSRARAQSQNNSRTILNEQFTGVTASSERIQNKRRNSNEGAVDNERQRYSHYRTHTEQLNLLLSLRKKRGERRRKRAGRKSANYIKESCESEMDSERRRRRGRFPIGGRGKSRGRIRDEK